MRKPIAVLTLAAVCVVASATSQTKKEGPPPPPKIKVGDIAPDFSLKHFDGTGVKEVSLRDFRGKKNVVLAFYVFAFTGG